MYPNDEKEIDLIDLLFDWLSHWRSLCVFLLIGVLAAGGYVYVANSRAAAVEPIDTVADDATLSTMTEEQLAALSLEDMESYLTEKDLMAVHDVITLNEEYLENMAAYNEQKDSMDLKDRAETLSYISTTKNAVITAKEALTDDELIYYYYYSDATEFALSSTNTTTTTDTATVSTGASAKKAIIIVLVAFFLHVVIVACLYIFNNKIKRSDRLSAMVGVPEYTRMIDWDAIDKKKGLDSIIARGRLTGVRRTALDDVIEINASATVEMMKNKNYSSVAVVGPGLGQERDRLVSQISKAGSATVVKTIDSITHSVNGADDIAGVDAAILAVRVAATRYSDFMEELQSLRDRDVDVIGIAVFE